MKKTILLFSILIFTSSLFAQAPQGINYQGVARDPFGNAISITNIVVRFTILQGSTPVYQENQSTQTDTFGLYSLVIGAGTPAIGTFNSIPWASGNLSVKVDINGSTIATTPLQSVPYALYAANSGSGGSANISGTANNIPRINNAGNGLGKSLIFQSADSSSIGINNSTPLPEALLDMVSTTKGLLIPRMTDVQRNAMPVSSLQHGMLVFQTNNASAFSPQGFWYYDAVSSAWLILAPAQAVWTLAGNAVGTNGFLGSLDDKDLVFKTGFVTPTERMRVLSNSNGGNIQFGGTAATAYKFPTAKGNPGQILQLDSSGATNNLYWRNPVGGGGGLSPWTYNAGSIFPTNFLTDLVGIGTNNPQGTLEIVSANNAGALNVTFTGNSTSPAINFQTQNVSNGSTVLDISTMGSGEAIRATATSGSALSGVSQSGPALWVQNTASGASTIDAENLGGHSAAFFHNNVVGGIPTMVVNNGDPGGFSAQFIGGLGLTTDGIQLSSPTSSGYVLTSDGAGFGTWLPAAGGPWTSNGGSIFQNNLSDTVGIGMNTPQTTLDILSSNSNGALRATNTSSAGGAGIFSVGNSANDSIALIAYTKGNGAAFFGLTQGSGNAGAFGILNSSSNASGIVASTNGNGKAVFGINSGSGYGGLFVINNAANDSAALGGFSIGKGPSVVGYNSGSGNAGVFQIANSSNTYNALDVTTNGTGRAGFFQINNTANNSMALSVSTNGGGQAIDAASTTGTAVTATATSGSAVNAANAGGGNTINSLNSGSNGSAGSFQINNNMNGNPALQALTSGGGSAIEGSATGTGAALYGNHSGSGPAVVGYNSGNGMAGSFTMVNPTSNTDALFVSTSSPGGFSGNFTGGKGLKTDKIQITSGSPQAGFVLSSSSTSGDGAWIPLPSATNFGTTVSSTAQTLSSSTTATVNLSAPGYQNGGATFSGNFFVAPSNGIYHFDVQISVNNPVSSLSGGNLVLSIFELTTNTNLKQVQVLVPSSGGATTFLQPLAVSADIPLTANQKVGITISNTSTGTNYQVITNPLLSWFNGHKVF